MTRLLLLAALVAAPALAQSDPALAGTADQFRDDVRAVTAMVATAALLHDADGAFPRTPFGLLGSAQAGRTDLRSFPLSDLLVGGDGDRLVLDYTPLPQDPYVRQDRVVRVVVTRDADGLYKGAYEITRRADPDDGGERLPYDVAGRYRVERGFGTACVDVETIRLQLASGSFDPEPGTLGPTPLAIRVHPPGEDEPVFYQEGR
ncbi:hypothetical protein [Rubrivirga sp.]|uniref:hypothetical protein n=1 Tax=Rubrivirga sp. TaxID=1885344 RepID=UPI003B524415